MAKILSLSELKNVKIDSSTKEFINSLIAQNLENGSFVSGTVYFNDFPARMGTAEIQVVIYSNWLMDITMTSTNVHPNRWHYIEGKWKPAAN